MSDIQFLRGRVSVSVWQDWSGVFNYSRYSWSDFCFVHLSVERTRYRGSACDTWEFHAALAGLHFMLDVWDGEGDRVSAPHGAEEE